jgi:2-polyprenyl-6-methoxyphenol hydroxylase-like FAD-dependent oxidoreductase
MADLFFDADVAIVGGGPAGSVTALLLARAGFDVVVLDRRRMPRRKPCGDCLSAQAARLLDRLGLLGPVLDLRPARLSGWRIVAPAGHRFESRFADLCDGDLRVASALALPRERLDTALLAAAAAAGARVLACHIVRRDADGVLRGRGEAGRNVRVRCRLAIGADGLRSVLARSLGAPARAPQQRKISLTAHASGVRGGSDMGEMHLAAHACLGIAPVTADGSLHNVTLVVAADSAGRAIARGADAFFRSALARFPEVGHRLDAIEIHGPLLASGPFDFPVRRVVADGCALVGDAAGYFDPFTGQGIYQAIASAELLAHEASAALHAGDVSAARLARYARRRRALLRGTRIMQRGIDRVLARPALANGAIRRLANRPAVADALVAVTGDLRPATTLASPALLFRFLAPSASERHP